MSNDDKYRGWKERPNRLKVHPDFAQEVMRRIHREAGQRQAQNWPGVLEWFQRKVSFQYAALVVAAIAGLSRLWFIFFAILKP